MQLQKRKDVVGMEKYGNGRKRKREEREEGIMITITYWEWLSNDNYYLMRMIINKKFCFSIQFFPVSIYSISINIVSKENVFHIYQKMENHRQYLKVKP